MVRSKHITRTRVSADVMVIVKKKATVLILEDLKDDAECLLETERAVLHVKPHIQYVGLGLLIMLIYMQGQSLTTL